MKNDLLLEKWTGCRSFPFFFFFPFSWNGIDDPVSLFLFLEPVPLKVQVLDLKK